MPRDLTVMSRTELREYYKQLSEERTTLKASGSDLQPNFDERIRVRNEINARG